ncbi:hypothetical protein EC973_008904 [Apophysomyces ossiformis]|uniref:Methyltransferase type 11 domain-containing protein n=1 Tax=Apophysomyces ossiformis TaxID=679940 RepID=A0A8H7BWC5_9FUNG|nr:hypothetical protein EC973_008904 [Apophysomyces ossiformis]
MLSTDEIDTTPVPDKREYHEVADSTYWLPKDEEEQSRLTGDMASAYPNSTFIGVDIVQVVNPSLMSDKVKFQYGNILHGLEFEDSTFDLVNMRFFVFALKSEEWPVAIKEVLRVTKPRGIIQMMEPEFKIPENAIVRSAFTAVMEASMARGQDPYIINKLEKHIEETGAKIIEREEKTVNLSSPTALAKKCTWSRIQGIKSVLPVVGPKLGLHSKEDEQRFLDETLKAIQTSNVYSSIRGNAYKRSYRRKVFDCLHTAMVAKSMVE